MVPSSCALLGGFAIGAWISLLWQRSGEREMPASACTRSMPGCFCCRSLVKLVDLQTEAFMDTSYYPYAALSCASFLTFYRKVSPAVSVKYFPIYRSLPHAKQVEWNTRWVSIWHNISLCKSQEWPLLDDAMHCHPANVGLIQALSHLSH